MRGCLDPLCQSRGLFLHKRAVEQVERLQRHIRDIAITGDEVRIRHIKLLQHVRQLITDHRQINRASIRSIEIGRQLRVEADQRHRLTVQLRHERPRPPRRVEQARHGEHRITNHLCVETAFVRVCQQSIVWIRLFDLCSLLYARLPIRLRHHDLLDQLLHRPSAVHEANREVVEQFGMTRPLAAKAEVVHGAHDARAEQMPPDAVDHHAGGERMVAAREPLRQLQPAALILRHGDADIHDLRKAARHGLHRMRQFAAIINLRIHDALRILNPHA